MAEKRYPILGKGELLAEAIPAPKSGGPKKPVRTFSEARERLIPQFEGLLNEIDELKAKDLLLPHNVFFQVSLDNEYLAKSYFPGTLIKKSGWEIAGSRPWYQTGRDKEKFSTMELSRMLFFSTDPIRIKNSYNRLRTNSLSEEERKDFVKIDNIGFHDAREKVIGFPDDFAVGVVELIFHPLGKFDWKKCRNMLIHEYDTSQFFWEWKRGGQPDLSFLPAFITSDQVKKLGHFNPLRTARPMPSVSIPRINKEKIVRIPDAPQGPGLRTKYPVVGVIDGGADTSIRHLQQWVVNKDMTEEGEMGFYIEHGTAVCGAALYGPYEKNEFNLPGFKVKSFRVFPVPRDKGLDLDLYKIIDWIEEIVDDPQNKDIKIYVLSFGPHKPIDDYEVDRFTATIDRLAYYNDLLFFVAAGNDGDLTAPFNRIQPPSDLVNGIGVGAFSYEKKKIIPADYCCLGPGRPGGQIKPDVSGFGGSKEHPFYVFLAGKNGKVSGVEGTSFSTPYVSALAANILYWSTDQTVITPQTSKALIIHHSIPFRRHKKSHRGWGYIHTSPEECMECRQNEVKVIYNGMIDLTQWVRLKLPFPKKLNDEGKVQFDWTFCYACDIRMETPDDYTLAGMEVVFRPHAYMYTYYKKGEKDRLVDSRSSEARKLESKGWKQSSLPRSMSYSREQKLRESGKWNTIQKGKKTQEIRNVCLPELNVHALGRGDWDERGGPGRIHYAAVVTVKTINEKIDIYNQVRAEIPQLIPIRLKTRIQSRV